MLGGFIPQVRVCLLRNIEGFILRDREFFLRGVKRLRGYRERSLRDLQLIRACGIQMESIISQSLL